MSDEIKPCPFCAGDIWVSEDFDDHGGSEDSWRFHCKDCDIEVVVSAANHEKAYALWNRRVAPSVGPATQKVVDAISDQYTSIELRGESKGWIVAGWDMQITLSNHDVDAFLAEHEGKP